MTKKNDCNLRDDRYCPGMDRVLQSNTRAKGLVLLQMRNRETFDISSRMVVYRAGTKASESPLLLESCPWCRKKLGQVKLCVASKKGSTMGDVVELPAPEPEP